MRHALGVLGVLAAGVLLAVSAAMNWRFGFYLGTTEIDGFIYGSASAAADCLKALIPFFIVAAWRNRMWSQMAASAVVWLVVTAYSLTSALGHAALNRQDTAGQRAAEAQNYVNLQSDLQRAKEQLSWVPQHRPAATVRSEIAGKEAHRAYGWSRSCARANTRYLQKFCGEYTALKAELGSAEQAAKLEQRIADTQASVASLNGAGQKAADPQAQILAKLTGFVVPGVSIEDVQTGLAVFIALLLEVGSGLGLYIAFSAWRVVDRREPTALAPAVQTLSERAGAAAEPVSPVTNVADVVETAVVANDNPTEMGSARLDEDATVTAVAETSKENDEKRDTTPTADNDAVHVDESVDDDRSEVQKFIAERTVASAGSRVNSFVLFSQYRQWAQQRNLRRMKHGEFKRECRDSGLVIDHAASDKSAAVTFRGIALKEPVGDKTSPAFGSKAA